MKENEREREKTREIGENKLIRTMGKKKKHRKVTTTTLTITTTKVKPSVYLCILDTNVANVQERKSFLRFVCFLLDSTRHTKAKGTRRY